MKESNDLNRKLLDWLEGDLSAEELDDLQKQMLADEELANEAKLLSLTKLKPDENIRFKNKNLLLKEEPKKPFAFVYSNWSKWASVAAGLLLIGASIVVLNQNKEKISGQAQIESNWKNEEVLAYNPGTGTGAENVDSKKSGTATQNSQTPAKKDGEKPASNKNSKSGEKPEKKSNEKVQPKSIKPFLLKDQIDKPIDQLFVSAEKMNYLPMNNLVAQPESKSLLANASEGWRKFRNLFSPAEIELKKEIVNDKTLWVLSFSNKAGELDAIYLGTK